MHFMRTLIVLAMTLLVVEAAALGADDYRLRLEVDVLRQETERLADAVTTLQGHLDDSDAAILRLRQARDAADHDVGQLRQENARLADRAERPELVMWNACEGPCQVSTLSWNVGGVPDTFDIDVSFEATVPMSVYFMSLGQYADFRRCGSTSCVSGTISRYGPQMSLAHATFTLAEGCAAYVYVLQAFGNGSLKPNLVIKRNPAAGATGVCAQRGGG